MWVLKVSDNVHTREHPRGSTEFHWRAIARNACFHRYNLGNNTFVLPLTTAILSPAWQLALHRDEHFDQSFITPAGQIVTTTELFDFVSKRASKVRFWISYCSFRARRIFAVGLRSSASCTTDRATATPAGFGDFRVRL